jgi:hypothetical protein
MIPGLLYYVNEFMGIEYVFIGICASLLYIPCWVVLQWWNTQAHPEVATGVVFAKEANPKPKLFGVLAIVGSCITFLAVMGDWTAGITGIDLMNSGLTNFEAYIPVIICAIGVLVAVFESVNFFVPGKTSKSIAYCALILTIAGIVLAAAFAVWAPSLDGSFFIAVSGLLVSVVLQSMQVHGLTSKKYTVRESSDIE